jgi:hypothetical protein
MDLNLPADTIDDAIGAMSYCCYCSPQLTNFQQNEERFVSNRSKTSFANRYTVA